MENSMLTTTNESAPTRRNRHRKVNPGLRRAIVLAMYGGYVAGAILGHISRTHHSTLLAVASFAVLAAAMAGALTVFYRTGYWTWVFGREANVDERQKAVRNLVYGYCYALYFALSLVAVLYCEIASDAHWWLPNRNLDADWIFWGVLAYGLTLPSAMLAWVDQPPPDEE
jgi:ABC-type multidrug transport system permease subunit